MEEQITHATMTNNVFRVFVSHCLRYLRWTGCKCSRMRFRQHCIYSILSKMEINIIVSSLFDEMKSSTWIITVIPLKFAEHKFSHLALSAKQDIKVILTFSHSFFQCLTILHLEYIYVLHFFCKCDIDIFSFTLIRRHPGDFRMALGADLMHCLHNSVSSSRLKPTECPTLG